MPEEQPRSKEPIRAAIQEVLGSLGQEPPVSGNPEATEQKHPERKTQEGGASKAEKVISDETAVRQGKEKWASSSFNDFEEYTPANNNKLKLEPDQIECWTKRLKSERVLLLQSEDWQVLRAAADALFDLPELGGRARWAKASETTFGAWLNPSPKHEQSLNPSSKQLLIVQAYEDQALSYLNSLPEDPTDVQKLLKEQEKRVLILTKPKDLAETKRFFNYAEKIIPYEEVHLKLKFPEQYKQLARDIRQLKEEKHWGQDELSSLSYIMQFLREDCIEEEIRRRSDASWNLGREKLSHIQDQAPLENTVKFVAAYFCSLSDKDPFSPQDFNRVVSKLLGNQTIEIKMSSDAPDNKSNIMVLKRRLLDDWNDRQQKIIHDCGLKSQSTPEGINVVFRQPDDRDALRKDFQSIFYWTFDDLYRRSLSAGLLFDDSRMVRQGMIDAILSRSEAEVQTFRKSILPEVLAFFHPVSDISAPLADTLQRLSTQNTRAMRDGLFELLEKLIFASPRGSEEGASLAFQILSDLLLHKCPEDAWRLTNRLQKLTAFAPFYPRILKQILDRSTGDLVDLPGSPSEEPTYLIESTLKQLYKSLENPTSIPTIVAILSWADKKGSTGQSRSEQFALLLAYWIGRSALFSLNPTVTVVLFEESADAQKLREFLVMTFLNPAIARFVVYQQNPREYERPWVMAWLLPDAAYQESTLPFWSWEVTDYLLDLISALKPEAEAKGSLALYQSLVLVSLVGAAQQTRKNPSSLVQAFVKQLSRSDREDFRLIISNLSDACIWAVKQVDDSPNRVTRLASREKLKAIRDSIQFTYRTLRS